MAAILRAAVDNGSFVHCRIFGSGRSTAILLTSLVKSGNDRLHRILFFSKNSANGSLQSTSVTGPENRQRRVWVDSASERPLLVALPYGQCRTCALGSAMVFAGSSTKSPSQNLCGGVVAKT